MPVKRAKLTNRQLPPSRPQLQPQSPPSTNISDEPTTLQIYFAHLVLISSVLCLVTVYTKLPQLHQGDTLWNYLKIPRTVGDAKAIGNLILKYKDDHYYSVFGAYFATYILLQSFCIPGSVVLSVLAGYLFPSPLALIIISACSTIGASTFYIMIFKHKQRLSKFLSGTGSNNRITRFNDYVQDKIRTNRSNPYNLFLCVFVLRATPIFPNWTINLCSPIVNLPFRPFVWGTFFGVVPLSVIHVWTGRILNHLSSDDGLFNVQSIFMSFLLGFVIFILAYLRKFA